jgi:CDP-ribitol ribitolphosphotransferase
LITDYSSAFYEFSILRHPILFFTYDRIIYENVRGVHHRIKDGAPGKVCDTFDELMTALETEDYELEKTISFADDNFPDELDGATDRVIDTVLFGEYNIPAHDPVHKEIQAEENESDSSE